MQKYVETIENPERTIFFLMAAVLLSLCIMYGYFLNATIMRVVAREGAMSNISELDGELSELEFAYIEKENSIDLNLAHEHHFVDIAPPLFVSRNSGGGLSLLPGLGDI